MTKIELIRNGFIKVTEDMWKYRGNNKNRILNYYSDEDVFSYTSQKENYETNNIDEAIATFESTIFI